MTSEEVCEMMDAIYAGEEYLFNLGESHADAVIRITSDRVAIDAPGVFTRIDDPRTAREIAAALVTWASTKDGIIFDQLGAASKVKAMQKRQGPELPRL